MESKTIQQKIVSRLASVRWWDVLKALLALVLTGIVLSRTNLRHLQALGAELSWTWLAASFLLFCLMTAVKGVQYWSLLGGRVPYGQTVRIVVIQNALTNLVAGAAGIASYLTLFRMDQNVKMSRSGMIFILTKAGDLFSMGLVLLISALPVWGRIESLRQGTVLLLAGILAALGIFWTAVLLRQAFVLRLRSLLGWLRLDRIALFERGLTMLQSLAGQDHRAVVRALGSGLALSLFYMTLTMAYAYCRVQAFHVPLDFWSILYISSLMQLVSLVPIQAFGGLGVTEVGLLFLFEYFGVVQVDLPAILIGLRVVFYLFNFGVLLYLPVSSAAGRIVRAGRPR